MIKYLEKNNFAEEIEKGRILVDFYADWCGPCKMMGAVLETMDENILKVNVDDDGRQMTSKDKKQRYVI